ncbi:MAG: T9SS type A sorting domain-containing protein [Chloroflexia bacterium]|nr:T9SS type A sorting domain-containing protein [Chloroflexia bacterium]
MYSQRPESMQEAADFNEFTRSFANSLKHKAAGEYIIPVVFHVYGTNFNGASVTNEIIEDALQRTNEDFQGLTADWNDIIPEFDGVKKALNITFKLAKIDPNGNSTTGIIYYSNAAGYGNGSGYDAKIQQDAWDNYKYMNVYIQNDLYNNGTTNNSGVAWYPDAWMSDNNLSRVVYNGAYLGSNTSENFRSVLTHEFGHWLNLIHTFEGGCPDAESCSTSGDMICDTPPANESNMNGALNCQGVVTNWENFMDYTDNYSMFTIDQVARMEAALQHSSRFPLWQESNLDATGVNGDLGPRLSISDTKFNESYLNDGNVDGEAIISAIYGAEFAATDELVEGTHFNISNLPSGLEAKIVVENIGSAKLSFTGNATAHDISDNVGNITLTFLDAAITGGVASLFSSDINAISLDFLAPYKIVHKDITDITASSSAVWTYFSIDNGEGFGIWVENNNLRFETYTKSMVCETGSRNITLISYNEEINSGRNWVAGGNYPDEHNLRTSSYKVWDGKTGYMGFQFLANEHPCYGWFKVSVSSDGSSYTLHEYAYNEEPYGSIAAGTKNTNGDLTSNFNGSAGENYGKAMIYPNPASKELKVVLDDYTNASVKLFGVDGKIQMEQILSKSSNSLNISGFYKGLYFLQLKKGEEVSVMKVIIQ